VVNEAGTWDSQKVDLAGFERIGADDSYLAVVATSRADGTVQASVVNAGVISHPVSGEQVVGFVTYGKAKLDNLRLRPWTTVVFRAGWQWATVEGPCDIIGPDDPMGGFEPSDLPTLLRSVFRAAGGHHSDWDEYDRVMKDERRAAVLIHPRRIYSNRG
jgi:PPOX class probable F420-dependent enzyme